VARLVNDCAIKDNVLLASQLFVLFTGMAGRVGFSGMEGDSFSNRYFNFGHSGYFQESKTDVLDFMSVYWLPLLRSEQGTPYHSDRKQHKLQDLTMLILNNAEPIKLACYVLPLMLALIYVNQLRVDARNEALVAESSALALQSEKALIHDRHEALSLALQAIRRARTKEATEALAEAFPLPVAALSEEQPVLDFVLSPSGRCVATLNKDHRIRLWGLGGELMTTVVGESAVFSPDGRLLATVTRDRLVHVWDLSKGQIISTLSSKITGAMVVFFPDGTHVITTGAKKTLLIWDTSTGEVEVVLRGVDMNGNLGVAISPDGKQILTYGMGTSIQEWSTSSGQLIATISSASHFEFGHVLHAEFSSNGRLILAATTDSDVESLSVDRGRVALSGGQLRNSENHDAARIWEAGSGKLLNEVRVVQISTASFSPDAKHILTSSLDGSVRLWNVVNGSLEGTFSGHSAEVRDARFTSNGEFVFSSSDDGTTLFWNASSGQLLARILSIGDVSSDGHFVVAKAPTGSALIVWSLSNAELLATLSGHTDHLYHVAYSPDGRLIATESGDKSARLWEATTGRSLATLVGPQDFAGIQFSRDSRRVITGGSDNAVRVWDASTGHLLSTRLATEAISRFQLSSDRRFIIASGSHATRVWKTDSDEPLATVEGEAAELAAIAPNGCCLLTARKDGTARIWRIPGGELLGTFAGNTGELYSVEFSPDSTLILTGGRDSVARILSVSELTLLTTLVGHRGSILVATFSPDGRRAVTSSLDRTTRLWDIATGRMLADITSERLENPYEFDFATFSGDGTRLVTVQLLSPELFVWDGRSGDLITSLSGHRRAVHDVAFSPDGNEIVSASGDGSARLYRFVSLRQVARMLKNSKIIALRSPAAKATF
jgi:WD40 repeat protein